MYRRCFAPHTPRLALTRGTVGSLCLLTRTGASGMEPNGAALRLLARSCKRFARRVLSFFGSKRDAHVALDAVAEGYRLSGGLHGRFEHELYQVTRGSSACSIGVQCSKNRAWGSTLSDRAHNHQTKAQASKTSICEWSLPEPLQQGAAVHRHMQCRGRSWTRANGRWGEPRLW